MIGFHGVRKSKVSDIHCMLYIWLCSDSVKKQEIEVYRTCRCMWVIFIFVSLWLICYIQYLSEHSFLSDDTYICLDVLSLSGTLGMAMYVT